MWLFVRGFEKDRRTILVVEDGRTIHMVAVRKKGSKQRIQYLVVVRCARKGNCGTEQSDKFFSNFELWVFSVGIKKYYD